MATTKKDILCDDLQAAKEAKKFFETGEGVAPMNAQHLKHFRTPGAVIVGEIIGENADGTVLLVLTKTE